MPDDEENEYEVESIIQARIEKQRGKLSWKFLVKWKGYDRSDNTWEPVESFEGSENLLNAFLERIDTGGRDAKNIRLFKVNEEFYPKGPPRRKAKKKLATSMEPPSAEVKVSGEGSGSKAQKRKRSSVGEADAPLKKRSRGRADAGKPSAPRSNSQQLPGSSPAAAKSRNISAKRKSGVRSDRKANQSSSDVAASEDSEDEIMRDYLAEPSGEEASRPVADSSSDLLSKNGVSKAAFEEPSADTSPSQEILPPHPTDDPGSPLFGDEDPLPEHVDGMNEDNHLPSHRVRAAHPLVKMVDTNFSGVDGGISTKARLFLGPPGSAQTSSSNEPSSGQSSSSRAQSGVGNPPKGLKKNKSSLLTFQKGSLKSVKGKYITSTGDATANTKMGGTVAETSMVSEELPGQLPWGNGQITDPDMIPGISNYKPPQPVPTAEELLQAAGLDTKEAEALPDFEEDPPVAENVPEEIHAREEIQAQAPEEIQAPKEVRDAEEPTTSILRQSLALAQDNLFPAVLSSGSVTGAVSAAWKRSTIFGPLGLGKDVQKVTAEMSSESATFARPFLLTLDSSVSIPIILKDISIPSTGSPSLDVVVSNCPKGPPGKFYREQFAHALLDTLRTGGSSARIEPDANITEDQKRHLDRFRERLDSGEMFVAVAGVEVLAFCSSNNALIGQRLNIPPVLLGFSNNVLVMRVVIEKHSAYADAAVHADSIRW